MQKTKWQERSHNIIFSEKGFATAYTVQSQFYSLNTTALKTVKLNMPKCVIARNAAIFLTSLYCSHFPKFLLKMKIISIWITCKCLSVFYLKLKSKLNIRHLDTCSFLFWPRNSIPKILKKHHKLCTITYKLSHYL